MHTYVYISQSHNLHVYTKKNKQMEISQVIRNEKKEKLRK